MQNMNRIIKSGMRYANGGVVPGKGTGDKIPAMLTPGEVVVPKSVLRRNPGLDTALGQMREQALTAEGKDVAKVDADALRGSVAHYADGTPLFDEQLRQRYAGVKPLTAPINVDPSPMGAGQEGLRRPINADVPKAPPATAGSPPVPPIEPPVSTAAAGDAAKKPGIVSRTATSAGNLLRSGGNAVGTAAKFGLKAAPIAYGASEIGAGLYNGDAEQVGLGALDTTAGAAMLTPAAPVAGAYLAGRAAVPLINSALGEEGREAVGGTINQVGQRLREATGGKFGFGTSPDALNTLNAQRQQAAPQAPVAAAAPAAAPATVAAPATPSADDPQFGSNPTSVSDITVTRNASGKKTGYSDDGTGSPVTVASLLRNPDGSLSKESGYGVSTIGMDPEARARMYAGAQRYDERMARESNRGATIIRNIRADDAKAQFDSSGRIEEIMRMGKSRGGGYAPWVASAIQAERERPQRMEIARMQNDATLRGQQLSADTTREGQRLTSNSLRDARDVAMRGQDLDYKGKMAPLELAAYQRKLLADAYNGGGQGAAGTAGSAESGFPGATAGESATLQRLTNMQDQLRRAGMPTDDVAKEISNITSQATKRNEAQKAGSERLDSLISARYPAQDDPTKPDKQAAASLKNTLLKLYGPQLATMSESELQQNVNELFETGDLAQRGKQVAPSITDRALGMFNMYSPPATNENRNIGGYKIQRGGPFTSAGGAEDYIAVSPDGVSINYGSNLSEKQVKMLLRQSGQTGGIEGIR